MKITLKKSILSLLCIFTIIFGLIGTLNNNISMTALDSDVEMQTKTGVDYLGYLSFTNSYNSMPPSGWGSDEPTGTNIQVVNHKDGHSKVVEFLDNSPSAAAYIQNNLVMSTSGGTIEFWIYGTKGSVSQDSFFVHIEEAFSRNIGVQFDYNAGLIRFLNSSSLWQPVCNITENQWEHIKITYEVSGGSYDGLTADQFCVYRNGTKYGPWDFHLDADWMNVVNFATNKTETDGNFYAWIDAVDYSWKTGYYIGRNKDYATPIDYFGLYSFTNDTVGTNPVNWSVTEPSNTYLDVIPHKVGHGNVVELHDNSPSAAAEMINNFTAPQSSGAIELWIYATRGTVWEDPLEIIIEDGSDMNIRIQYCAARGFLKLLNSSGLWEDLTGVSRDTWIHLKITFECGSGGYDGLAADSFYIYTPFYGGKHGPFGFGTNCSTVSRLRIGTNTTDADPDFYAWVDAVDYSWAPGYYDGRNKDYESGSGIPGFPLLFSIIGIFGIVSIFILNRMKIWKYTASL